MGVLPFLPVALVSSEKFDARLAAERRLATRCTWSILLPDYPSAWLRPRSARFCFTWRSHCSCRARPRKPPGHCLLPTKLPLPASLFQLTITRRMNLRLSSLQHILRRHIADCAVQTHRVVALHVALNQAARIFQRSRREL